MASWSSSDCILRIEIDDQKRAAVSSSIAFFPGSNELTDAGTSHNTCDTALVDLLTRVLEEEPNFKIELYLHSWFNGSSNCNAFVKRALLPRQSSLLRLRAPESRKAPLGRLTVLKRVIGKTQKWQR